MYYSRPIVMNDDDDDGDKISMISAMRPKPYQHYETTYVAQHIHYYIDRPVSYPHEYTDMIHRLTYASPDDVFYIHVNTPGGNLETGIQIINAMQNSQATVITILESATKSLGTFIFLAGDQMVVNDNCMMMFHDFSTTIDGKGGEIVSHIGAAVKWFTAIAKKIYVPFLSEDELSRILKGEDLWLMSSDIRKRLDRVVKASNAKAVLPTKKSKADNKTADTLS